MRAPPSAKVSTLRAGQDAIDDLADRDGREHAVLGGRVDEPREANIASIPHCTASDPVQ